MQGKTVVVSVLIMSMVLAQIQVEAKLCCPAWDSRAEYNECMAFTWETHSTVESCCASSGCKVFPVYDCPSDYPYDMHKYSGDAMNQYCKLGCVSSVCGALNTLQNSDASEIVNGAAERCAKACSTFCTKGTKTAVGSA